MSDLFLQARAGPGFAQLIKCSVNYRAAAIHKWPKDRACCFWFCFSGLDIRVGNF